ncbi:hypothetical protein EJ06DRAFT_551376 [Trichodelitschia bisporula]|uniref:Microtubule associated protein n=1 Tax=Trichodelitschia bisporula TaxID=703511 RepID=A0A6G1HLW9_9PEZI|nr:hypothetical protein EJ06DRAFT_551376 [Trichodelitschia bisporula]
MDSSYLEKQVKTITQKLHELFDEIGVPGHERDTRESELFAALSETLHTQLRIVTNEKHEIAEEANRLITEIKQMHISIEGPNGDMTDIEHLAVTYPLLPCLDILREKHRHISAHHASRYEQVTQLVQALHSYSTHLEPNFVTAPLPPSPKSLTPSTDLSHTYFAALDDEFTRVYDEYHARVATVKALCEECITLWAELGTPQAQTDARLVALAREAPEQVGLTADHIAKLTAKRDRLVDEKKARERRLRDLKTQVEALWERLGIAEGERRQFEAYNRGVGLRVVNEYESELGRLNELKRQNLGLFVEDARVQLQALWDELFFSEEEMLEFTPAFSDVYSDALLSAHETELARLTALKNQRAPLLSLITKHRTLIQERDDLAASSQDASRLMLRGQKGEKRDPTRLLREEKMRKRIAKDLPKVEVELRAALERWEDEYGRPFTVLGERYLDELDAAQARAAPPRSKTPSQPPPRSKTPSQPAPKAKPAPASNASKGSTRAPPRAKTPTGFARPTVNPATFQPTSSISQPGGSKSPSRIPARAPLNPLASTNSPERRYRGALDKPAPPSLVSHASQSSLASLRGMPPPAARMPPPKMDLYAGSADVTPTPAPRGDVMVRAVQVEDVFDQRERQGYGGYQSAASTYSSTSAASSYAPGQYTSNGYGSHHSSMAGQGGEWARPQSRERDFAPRPMNPAPSSVHSGASSRQISQTSSSSRGTVESGATSGTSATAVSSENWETYSDTTAEGEEGGDVGYYARLRQGAYAGFEVGNGKRAAEEGWVGVEGGKKAKEWEESGY